MKLISHKEVTAEQLKEIITIKSKAWAYSFDKQVEWINSNLKETDFHVLLSLNERNLAYLNLIEIELKIDDSLMKGYGIGNVCASERGMGWGSEIMTQTNSYLKRQDKTGLLFCKDSLVNFYRLNKWELIEKKNLSLSFDNTSIESMIFNCKSKFLHLEYHGKPF